MAHSLEDLKSGKLVGSKRLKLACGLTEFPLEILELSETLEILDLSGNSLSELPDSIQALKRLKIIFFANNQFKIFPKVLAELPSLTMIGFKANQIHTVPENSFPPFLQWLILTDNQISELPQSIGSCHLLQKCALAGNLIEELPVEMMGCKSLELLRISANQLEKIPKWLFELPKLSWVAFGGNPASFQKELDDELDQFDWNDFEVQELLGEGASGLISKAQWKSKAQEVAIKVFKGDVTSDGLPEDEMDISIAAGEHDNLVQVLGEINNHPDGKSGLIMKLITPNYLNLGNPPSFDTCTRDVFDETCVYSESEVLKIAKSIASVCAQLHKNGINHGDLYAHNIMVNETAHSLLGDFGAASFYDVNSELSSCIERVEVRAFGCLLEDLVGLMLDADLQKKWKSILSNCMQPEMLKRPSFASLVSEFNSF